MRRRWLKRTLTRKVILHLKNDTSIEGVLVAGYRDGVALRHARVLNSKAPATEMAGEVFVPREQIAFAQAE